VGGRRETAAAASLVLAELFIEIEADIEVDIVFLILYSKGILLVGGLV
jgi:hypothetical protein